MFSIFFSILFSKCPIALSLNHYMGILKWLWLFNEIILMLCHCWEPLFGNIEMVIFIKKNHNKEFKELYNFKHMKKLLRYD